MNQSILIVLMVVSLVTGCRKQAPVATLPPASENAAEARVTAPATAAPTPASTDDGLAPTVVDDRRVNTAIDKVLGEHGKYQAVIEAYQAAVASGDRNAVAALVRYPLEVTVEGSRMSIRDAAAFVQDYDRILTPAIARVITTQKYSELVVNQQGVMFGNGETWVNGICKPGSADCSEFEVRIIAIQPAGAD